MVSTHPNCLAETETQTERTQPPWVDVYTKTILLKAESKLNHPDISWESNAASCKQSMGPLQCLEDSVLVQVWARNEYLLDLGLTSGDEIIKGVKMDDSLGCNNLALIEFVISWSTVKTLNIERVKFQLFRG